MSSPAADDEIAPLAAGRHTDLWLMLGDNAYNSGTDAEFQSKMFDMYPELMRQIGERGVYGNPELPDFMVFLNWQELPWFWHGFDQFWFAGLLVSLAPGILAFVFGYLAFRSRVTGVYLSIITQALTYALMLAFFRNEMGFGGNNGLTDFKDILGFDLQSSGTRIGLLFLSLSATVACLDPPAVQAGERTARSSEVSVSAPSNW